MKRSILFTCFIVILGSCQSGHKIEKEIEKTPIQVEYAFFHQDFFTAKPQEINRLKSQYPYMFPANVSDASFVKRMQDEKQLDLFKEVSLTIGDLEVVQKDLNLLFKHIKYYQPPFTIPKVVTDITGLSYQDRVLYANDMLLLSLDFCLGKEHEFYQSFPGYIKEHFTKQGMLVEVAKVVVDQQMKVNRDRTFLGKIIFEGKKQYLIDLFLPQIPEAVKMGYSDDKMIWANQNQAHVWSYFIKNDLLYSNKAKLSKRFIDLAPFSKFYTAIDKDTPGRIGVYIGYLIVKSFMENHSQTSLSSLLTLDAQTLLDASGFKPLK